MLSEAFQFPDISDGKIRNDILPELYQWSLSNGLIMYLPNFSSEDAAVAPTTIYPTPIPKESFENAVAVQKSYNELYARISQDKDSWLREESAKMAKFDVEFTGRLWETYLKAKEQGISQKLRLGVFRSDYLIDKLANEIKQVEFNTVSVSFGGLSTKVGELHSYLNKAGKYSVDSADEFYKEIPISDSGKKLAESLAFALNRYDTGGENPIVAFIVQKNERNTFDQKVLEYNLLNQHNVKSVRLTFDEVQSKTKMDPETKRLYVSSTGEEIGVVYFRTGYAPKDFESEVDWDTRLYLEVSHSIKAPDLLTQLSGTKKIQQLLTNEENLSKFISDKATIKQLTSTFVNIYPLDDTTLGEEGKRLAFESPERYVLKPQREGGGNNIYREDIPIFLNELDKNEWNAYILMELIQPEPTTKNIIVRGTEVFKEPIVSELGIFGCIFFDDEEIHFNKYCGWLLRSKFTSSNEGGVAAGFGCVDSIVLY